jgi:hypothetical protein
MSEATDPVPSAPDSLTEMQAKARARKLRVALVLLVGVPVLLGGGGYLLHAQNVAKANREIKESWQQATGCLLGTPLEPGQGKASVRFRRIQLEAVRLEQQPEQKVWPERCADPVAHVNTVLRKHGRTDGTEGALATEADKLAVVLRKAGQLSDVSAPVDAFVEAGSKAKLDTKEVGSVAQPPPAPREAFDVDSLPKTALVSPLQYTIDNVSTQPMPGPELHLLVYDVRIDKSALLCTFTAAGPEAACRKLGGEMAGKPALVLEGTTDPGALPLVLVGQRGSEGIFRADTGERIGLPELSSGYVAKNGYLAIVTDIDYDTGAFTLAQQKAPGAKLERAIVKPQQMTPEAKQLHRVNIFWNKLVVQSVYDDAYKEAPRLQFAELPNTKPEAAFTDIGIVDWVNASYFACRSGDALAMKIGEDSGYLVFFNEGRWSKPLAVNSFFGGTPECDGAEMVLGTGALQRCTSSGCKNAEGANRKLNPFQVGQSDTAYLNGKELFIAVTDGGMRFRHGPSDQQLLFDDHIKDGSVQSTSTLLGWRLYGRGRFAVAVLSTPAGLYAAYFDATGKPWPAKITFAG